MTTKRMRWKKSGRVVIGPDPEMVVLDLSDEERRTKALLSSQTWHSAQLRTPRLSPEVHLDGQVPRVKTT